MSADGLVESLLELGDMTSRNLAFAHRQPALGYSEETITETNLLELRRRHPVRTYLQMFTHRQEARNGADWEWHLVGRRQTLGLRVQAKRVQSDDVLKVRYKVKGSGALQRDLLIRGAAADGLRPMYCVYSSERQRGLWKSTLVESYEAGCLLVDARDVGSRTTCLSQIEGRSYPWHFLVTHGEYARQRSFGAVRRGNYLEFRRPKNLAQAAYEDRRFIARTTRAVRIPPLGRTRLLPTVDDLNRDDAPVAERYDETGVRATTEEDIALVGGGEHPELIRAVRMRLREERPGTRILAVDVRGTDSNA